LASCCGGRNEALEGDAREVDVLRRNSDSMNGRSVRENRLEVAHAFAVGTKGRQGLEVSSLYLFRR
jgi:hypothetical protein